MNYLKRNRSDEDTSLQYLKAPGDLSEKIHLDPFLSVQGLKGPWLILVYPRDSCPVK